MPRSGVTYAAELEWRFAARWAGYRFADEFLMLDGEEQSAIVAAYHIYGHIAAVLEQEQARKPKPKQPTRRKR